MMKLPRSLLMCSASFGLLLAGCQAKTSETALADDVSKDELVAMMKSSMEDAKSTSGLGSPVVWTFSDDDTTVYLFGTVHLLKPEVKWSSPALETAIAEADTLVLEADMTSPESQANLQKLVMEYGVFSDERTLLSVLDDDDKVVVEQALQSYGVPIAAVEKMKPWMVGLQLGVMQIMQAGYNPQSGVESLILAQKGDKDVEYLETAETQIKVLGGAPIEGQVQGLMATLGTMELGVDYLDTLVAEWADGDVSGINAMMANPAMFGTQDAYDALLKTRNENWIPDIKSLLDNPGTKLVAVGAGHLAGSDSVIAMLTDDGVKVSVVN